jgi:hypothetical protein
LPRNFTNGNVTYLEIPEDILKMYHYSFVDKERVKTKLGFYTFEKEPWFTEVFLKGLIDHEYQEGVSYYANSPNRFLAPEAKRFMMFKETHPNAIAEKDKNKDVV